jgi:Bacterial conjugation TrbI-like protein
MSPTPPSGPPQPRLRYGVLTALSLGVLLLGYLLWTVLPPLLTRAVTPGSEEPPTIATPAVQEQAPRDYTRYGPKEETAPTPAAVPQPPAATAPVAQLLQRSMLTGTSESQERLAQQQGVLLAGMLDLMQFLKREREEKAQQPAPATATTQTTTPGPQTTSGQGGRQQGAQPPARKKVAYLAVPEQGKEPGKLSEGQEKELKRLGEVQDIIRPAKWAIPAQPLKTIYRSMRMTGVLLDSINTDIPSNTIRIELTEDLKDKFSYDQTILARKTIVIAQQVGKAEFGQKRVPLKIEQFEPPTGEVLKVEGGIGDKDGAAGVPGKVNGHLPELLLAAGINAVMNLGLGYATGTPGAGQFYQDPAQRAAQDAGQSVARDVNEYTRQVLKRSPTIDVDAHPKKAKDIPIVTIFLTENLQLNHAPVVAK